MLLYLVTEDWYFRSHRLGIARRARDSGYEVLLGTRVNAHADEFLAEGFRLCPIPFERSLRFPLRDIAAVRAIRGVIARERPTVVHLVSLKPILLGGLALTSFPHIPVVHALTGLGYLFSSDDRMARRLRPLVVMALRCIARRPRSWILVQNHEDLAALAAAGVGIASHSTVIRGSGLDLDEFRFRPLAVTDEPLVLLPARLLIDKGVGEFVAAAREIKSRRPKVRFVLCGGHDVDNHAAVERELLEAWVDEGVVEWWGHREDMADVYRQASIVCLPSYREGLPKALLEAAACGSALVASDVPGCREICVDGETGLAVKACDSRALAAAVERLLDDYELRARLAQAGRTLVEREFSLDKVATETLALYETMRQSVVGSVKS